NKINLKRIHGKLEYKSKHSTIEFSKGRVKPIQSIIEKAEKRQVPLERIEQDIQDIAGVRVVCQFVDDIYTIVKMLRAREDFIIIAEKDYISRKKTSGYRSCHMIIE